MVVRAGLTGQGLQVVSVPTVSGHTAQVGRTGLVVVTTKRLPDTTNINITSSDLLSKGLTSCLGRCQCGRSSCLDVSSRSRPPPGRPPPPPSHDSRRCDDSDGSPCLWCARGNTCTGNNGSLLPGAGTPHHSPRHSHRRGGPSCSWAWTCHWARWPCNCGD